ncbi:MAG: thiamine pyrophosphate-dependent enzyme [Pseudomonadota bacterium]
MSIFNQNSPGARHLMMGNEAIVRGAVEAGISVAAGYPGTPSSEIIERLSKACPDIYSEWSVNEKVALEVAAAGSFAGLRALAVMKQPGVNVAADFLMHLALSGIRGGMVLVAADDPGALSSINEGETRYYARLMEIPMLEPGDFQEAKDMTRWAFELSETLGILVMVRTVTRLSHASGPVVLGDMLPPKGKAVFNCDGNMLDPADGLVMTPPVGYKRNLQHQRLARAQALFETSPFNTYEGPERPELLIITSSICSLYSREAVQILGLSTRVGILKLGTTWPLPQKLIQERLALTPRVLFVEEVQPFVEEGVKILAAESGTGGQGNIFFGKHSGHIPVMNELNPDLVIKALAGLFGLAHDAVTDEYKTRTSAMATRIPDREISFCPGCPHRASYFTINTVLQLDNRKGFTCGDIGCYSMGMLHGGYFTLKTLHSMGSGSGLASGFGKLGAFGMDQPVLAVCGDSTFFHSGMPPLVNAIHTGSQFTMVILDNSGTAMTGFQPHPGLPVDARGNLVPGLDIASICQAMGAETVVCDPFDLEATQAALLELIQADHGVKVLVLRQACALSPERKRHKAFDMAVDPELCLGGDCGCNRLCTRVFACPGLIWDKALNQARINEYICAGCGVCTSVCPNRAITRKERPS